VKKLMPEIAYQGNISNNKQWCDTWEEYFSQNLRYVIDLERTIHGADPEMDDLSLALIEKIVPRLPRSRETGGNEIKPVLLNGDMWHGNVNADSMTGDPILYDPGSFYGHHEYDLAPRRAAKYQFGETHRSAYLKLVAASDPQEDCNDRNALYTL
jgi:protein-ribulosamine 3-kinase